MATLNELFSEYLTAEGISENQAIIEAAYEQLLGEPSPSADRVNWWLENFEDFQLTADNFAEEFLARAGDATDEQLAEWGTSSAERDAVIAAANGAADEAESLSDVSSAVQEALDDDDDGNGGGTPGDQFSLTSGTDALTGTANNDLFEGYLAQNPFAGGVSNTLSSADRIDGGAGTDTLDVELVSEFVGATAGTSIDVQARTSSVENIEFEARDLSNAEGSGTVTVDAKNMTGIERIGSHFSDGDLVIENLTTLTDDGAIRLTDDITVVMQHTDNFNSDGDASDLTVLFDEDYLNTSTESGGSTLLVRLVNAVTNVTNSNPIFGTDSFTFMVGETEVTVDVTDIAADDTLDYTTAYNQVADAIEAAAAAAGFDGVSAELQALSPTVFSIPVNVEGTEYEVGDSAGSYFPILVTNEGSEDLTQGSFTQADVATDTDINSSQSANPAAETEVPISVNVELEKVGRDGEGGNLVIGGKDLNSTGNSDTDQDQNNGIEVFNISVVGNASKPSNLGQIISTDNALKTVNIVTADTTLSSFAALTVRGELTNGNDTTPFGGTLDTLNANGLLGNLQIGQNDGSRAVDIETFTATGGGDVTYWTSIGEGGDLASLGNLAYSATTGAGSDVVNADVEGGAQYTVTTGSGDDTVVASVTGETDSGSTDTKIYVNSAGGSNTVTLSSVDLVEDNEAEVTLGNGADTVTGGETFLTAETGGGNDAVYTENTGTKAIATTQAGASVLTGDANDEGTYLVGNKSELLFGRTVQVTLDLPEDAGTANTAAPFVEGLEATFDIAASNGHLTTERDLYEAVANAINNDAVMSKLAEAEVDSNGQLIVTYLIDGVTDEDDIVQFEVLGEWADLSATEQSSIVSELQALYEDSDIAAADVENEYDEVLTQTDVAATDGGGAAQEGTDSTDDTDNSVNAGLGDDVVVLSSDAGSVETLVFDEGGFGNDTVVHFDQPTDLLDFSAWLDNVESTSSSSVSETRIDGTVAAVGAIIENSVVVTDMSTINDNDAGAGTALDFDTMTDAGVLAELNGGGTEFVASANDANLVGDLLKVIILIEDDANATATDDNEGFYKAYEVIYDDNAGEFTEATLVGSLDLGSDDAFDALASANIV